MICGALQTLNEEAFEDVVASERPSPTGGPAGETIANDTQSQSKSQPQQQQQQQSSQQALTPIQETVEHDRSSHAFCTDRRQSSTQNITIVATNMHKSHSNHSGLSLDDRQYSTHSLSSPSTLSQSPLLHSTPTILLTKSDERLNATPNPNKLKSSASTVILMPNSCDDNKYDRTHL